MTSVVFAPEAETRVFVNSSGNVVVVQPLEGCPECGKLATQIMCFSPDRARRVASAMLELAGEKSGEVKS